MDLAELNDRWKHSVADPILWPTIELTAKLDEHTVCLSAWVEEDLRPSLHSQLSESSEAVDRWLAKA